MVLVVALSLETGACRDIADRILVVDCPEPVHIERTMARSELSRAEVERILVAQSTRKARLAIADDLIVNDAGLDERAKIVGRLHER